MWGRRCQIRSTKMSRVPASLLLAVALLCLCPPAALEGLPHAPFCPEYQEGFDSSCYEFVNLRRMFLDAQSWCERGGGHLAFVLNDETQQFLQKHLEPGQDWWLGLAPTSQNLTLDIAAAEAPLSWLDGSDVSYANWVKDPAMGAGCGHVLKHSGFQWEATDNCTQELHFVCEFESGRSFACVDHNVTLQCGSGQVIEIDDSFYGRKTLHYCRPGPDASPPSTQEECSWVDVVDLVAGHCHGLQACQAAADVASFGEPCPGLGSYLSVEYHCKDAVHLLVTTPAAVFDNVTISVKWLLHPYRGNLTCTLSAGDGHTIDPYSPQGSEPGVVHQYHHPGVFTVTVECTTSEWHVTAQRTVAIQEPLGEFGLVRCYSQNQLRGSTDCYALYLSPLEIQVELEAGSDVTYRVQSGETVLATTTVVRGILPQNLTVGPAAQQQLGPGCHPLSLLASNGVAGPEAVTSTLQVCLLEPVEGLQASLAPGDQNCPDANLKVSAMLAHGAPSRLLFRVSGADDSFDEAREMKNGSLQVFTIATQIQGLVNVRVTATNHFSDMELDAGNVTIVCNHSETKGHPRGTRDKKMNIKASPDDPKIGEEKLTLEAEDVPDKSSPLEWTCSGNCSCPLTNQNKQEITETCLPEPYALAVYTVTTSVGGWNVTASKCIMFTAKNDFKVTITCSNCSPVNPSQDVHLSVQCADCTTIKWYFEEENGASTDLTSRCSNRMPRPYILSTTDSPVLVVKSQQIEAATRDIKVMVLGTKGDKSASGDFTITLPQTQTTVANALTTRTSVPPPFTSSGTAITRASYSSTISSTYTGISPVPSQPAGITPVPSRPAGITPVPSRPAGIPPVPSQPASAVTSLSCNISPPNGTEFTAFSVSCDSESLCSAAPCKYCFKTANDHYLRCVNENTVKSLFLPLGDGNRNYTLTVMGSIEYGKGLKTYTTFTAQVRPARLNSTVQDLQSLVSEQSKQLQQNQQLSGVALSQMYQSISAKLNQVPVSDQAKGARMELRKVMMNMMSAAVKGDPSRNSQEVQVTAEALVGLTQQVDEMTFSTQLQASGLLASLSQVLISMNGTGSEAASQKLSAVRPIVMVASNILQVSPGSGRQRNFTEISGQLLQAMDNLQTALLAGRELNDEPVVINSPQISIYANRMSSSDLQGQVFSIQNNYSASFTFPPMNADILPADQPVDVRMTSYGENPFSQSEGVTISGTVVGLSLTAEDGTMIPVGNLTEEIEILLPRPDAAQMNSTLLDLGNFSTIAINVTAPNVSLVLKLDPSESIPLMLLLGFKEYPNDTHHQAQIQLPREGQTQEERYTWVLGPEEITETGVFYLLVRPVVEAGVNSTNATVSVVSIASQCVYWDEAKTEWSNNGCRVGPRTNASVTQCLCNHLTFFGSSFFVMPNVVDVSRTAELFSTFVKNPVVVCFVGAIFLAYILAIVWARRKDLRDTVKVKIAVLEDNDPLAQYRYMLNVSTGHRRGASTSSQVTVTLLGSEGESDPHHLTDPDKPLFERGGVDIFLLTTPFSLGELKSIRLWHDNSGGHPAWYVNKVMVQDLETGQKWHFLCNSWLAIDVGECVLDKVFSVASELDLKGFSNLFYTKTAKDFRDGHIWYSVINRPPSSSFTRVQRLSCCFSLLLCTMLTSIMFWGIPKDPSEQKMDLGNIEFTWQQVMIGVQSSIIMFPINLLIVSIFRNTRPRDKRPRQADKKTKVDTAKQGKVGRVSPSPGTTRREITPDAVIKDIKRIAQSLCKTLKSPLPQLETEAGSTVDINNLLALVEDIIRKQNRAEGEFFTDGFKKEGALILSLGAVDLQEGSLSGSPETSVQEAQRQSDYSRFLFRQLQHVEQELELLGPERFSKQGSYERAVQQVRSMKGQLESRLSSSSPQGEQLAISPGPAERGGKCCQQNGLPWWFVFVGWLLVGATSSVSAYFTMMYGLKYGKERSISWLISMVVSFFESLFITQPLKVLGFAVFFALVLKKVDQEDYEEVPIENALASSETMLSARRDSTCSFYQPPPSTDIEKMKSQMMKEQKVFALIREILTYAGFLWMLLLVAYGQRNPNAFFLTQHIQQSFSSGISDTMSHKDVFAWANTTLLKNLFGQYPGFITDGNSKLVGNARLRQVRVQMDSCRISRYMRSSVADCHAPYSWDVEDMGSYGPSWNSSTSTQALGSPWQYQSQSQLRAHPVWGRVVLYRGGGFVADLGPDQQNTSRILQYLFDNTWLDEYTRALFVEFTVYNANVNLFCIVALMLETSAVGAFQYRTELQTVRLYQATGGMHLFVMASEAVYFLFILYYMFVQGKLMKQQRWAYFSSKWNLLELAIIILSWSALSVFIKRTLLGNRDVEYYQNHRDQFASFYDTAAADAVLGYLIAFLVLLATIKLWHLLRLNPKLHMITATLQRAWTDISGFITVITVMFLAYSIASNLMFGWKLYSYRTLLDAAQTMVSLQLGFFNYEEILDYNPVLGAFLIGSCIVFMTFVVMNLFISVILVAFSQEQLHHKPSDEEEVVDLMLMKLCSLFGIKFKSDETGGKDRIDNCPSLSASINKAPSV